MHRKLAIAKLSVVLLVGWALSFVDMSLAMRQKGNVSQRKIVKEESAVKFIDSDGKIVKTIPLKSSREIKEAPFGRWKGKGPVVIVDEVMAEVSENQQYVAITTDKAEIAHERAYSTSTFQYFNVEGKLQWEKSDIPITYPPSYAISQDGLKILLVTAEIPINTGEELYPHWPALYDEKGNELWKFGAFDQISYMLLTKNGKYGLFMFELFKDYKVVCGILFFDIEEKKIHRYEFDESHPLGSGDITETGKAIVYKVERKILDASTRLFKTESKRIIIYEYQF